MGEGIRKILSNYTFESDIVSPIIVLQNVLNAQALTIDLNTGVISNNEEIFGIIDLKSITYDGTSLKYSFKPNIPLEFISVTIDLDK